MTQSSESALVLIKGLFAQVHDIIDDGLDRRHAPEGRFLGPFGSGSERVWIDGRMRIINSETEYNELVIPDSVMTLEKLVKVVLLVPQTIDRRPSNNAVANFLTYEKQLALHSIAGVCHDLWNAINNSSKKKRTIEGKA